MKEFSDLTEAIINLGKAGAIAWQECAQNLKRVGRYIPKEGDRVVCLYQGNGIYGLEAIVITVAHLCDRVYIKFDNGKIIPFSFDDVMLRDRYHPLRSKVCT